MNTKQQIKFKGSTGWLIFWIIIFWPVAIIYWIAKRQIVKVLVEE